MVKLSRLCYLCEREYHPNEGKDSSFSLQDFSIKFHSIFIYFFSFKTASKATDAVGACYFKMLLDMRRKSIK